ncbi:MAG: amidohydrolase [Deltaproteobacteria bacterium]|nr:amidohydrolase [Deltaproteobacteria bacterium]
MKIDVFSHIMPGSYFRRMVELDPKGGDINSRIRVAAALHDLDERFRAMDEFGDYAQILSLVAPPIESYGSRAAEMARLANDGLAELVRKYPDRFLGFVASLPMNEPEGLLAEARRAVEDLGAAGVQVFTNVSGHPLDRPETLPLFELMAELDRPVWMHPTRGADFPDYQRETRSRYEIWWAFGWPHETSVAMAHLVFSGLFDRHPDLKIITHHMGGTIPYLEGKVGPGFDALGTRTTTEDYGALLRQLKRRPIDYFRMFYADTALFGARAATVCGLDFFGVDHTLFGTDAPFGPEGKWGYTRWTIEVIDGLELAAADRQAIYEGNARRLLKL